MCCRARRRLTLGVHLFVVAFVVAARDVVEPRFVFEVPTHGVLNAFFKLEGGFPTEFLFEFGRVDGVAEIVARAVGDVGDEVEVCAFGTAEEAVDGGDDDLDDVDVLPLVETTNVVSFRRFAFVENEVDGAGVVYDVEPVAYVFTLTINGEGLAVADVVDEKRDELFGELVRAVVVRAIRHDGRHTVGVVEGADEVVARSLGGGVGRVGIVGRGFEEEIIAVRSVAIGACEFECAIDFVGRDMVETLALVSLGKAFPIEFGGLEEGERAHHVGAGKSKGIFDRTVDVALGGKVDNALYLVLLHEGVEGVEVADVHLDKRIVGLVLDVLEVGEVARVGEFVETDDMVVGILVDEKSNDVAADKTGTTGDDDGFHGL